MKKIAILFGHQGYGGVTRNAKEIRECGYEPFILTSKPIIPTEKFIAAMEQMGLNYYISDLLTLNLEEVIRAIPEPLENYAFCLSVWEGQRLLVAQINELLGANDVTPELIRLMQDKYELRKKLYDLKLTNFNAYSYDDLKSIEPLNFKALFVKPKCSTGSLCSKKVNGTSAAIALMQSEIHYHDDFFFSEFYDNIELFAEPYINGREYSFELVMHNGMIAFCTAHEKLRVEELHNTVLEVSFCSPPIHIDSHEVALGQEKIASYLSALNVTEGCYHIELRYDSVLGWELIEINPRTGGGLIYDSVIERHGVKMISEWVKGLTREPMALESLETAKGTYFQIAYAEPGQQIETILIDDSFTAPAISQKILNEGDTPPTADREVFGAFNMWLTPITEHTQRVRKMDSRDYMEFVPINSKVLEVV